MPIFSELKKALTTSGDGADLVPQNQLDSILKDELYKMQPLLQMMDVLQAEGKTHEYRARTSHPQGWFEGENTGATNKNGVYTRKTVSLKIARAWGSVTGFAQKVDEPFINALAEELTGALEGMSNVYEFGTLYGCADDIGFTGDAYQFSGILPRLYKYAATNVVDAGGNKIELADLDLALYNASNFRQVRNDPKLWFMGGRMKQVVDGLQTKVQLPLSTATLADGKIEMAAYGKTPIFESDYVVPASTTTSPAAVGAQGGNDEGTLAAGTYTYKISSVTIYGEQVAGTASSGIVADATHLHVDLSWTADANAKLYMIWRQLSSGGYFLLDIIPALTYDADGKVNGTVATYTDLGSKTPITAVKPLASGEQIIVLANLNAQRGAALLGLVDDMGQKVDNLFQFVELARIKDSYDFMLKGYNALRMVHPNLFSVIRHATLS